MPALNLNENKVFIVWTSVWLVDGILWNLFKILLFYRLLYLSTRQFDTRYAWFCSYCI
jgi:hypothetical protein